jgi:hypothetical protein
LNRPHNPHPRHWMPLPQSRDGSLTDQSSYGYFAGRVALNQIAELIKGAIQLVVEILVKAH